MNPAIITIIIAAITVILAIFGAGWLNLQILKSYLDAKIGGLESTMNAEFKAVRAEFKAEIAPLGSDVGHLKQTTEKIERQLETIFGKLVWPKSSDFNQ